MSEENQKLEILQERHSEIEPLITKLLADSHYSHEEVTILVSASGNYKSDLEWEINKLENG